MDNHRATRISGGFGQAHTLLIDLSSLRESAEDILSVIARQSQPVRHERIIRGRKQWTPLTGPELAKLHRTLRKIPSERMAHSVVRLMQSTIGLYSYGHEPFDAAAQQYRPTDPILKFGGVSGESALHAVHNAARWSLTFFGRGIEPSAGTIGAQTVIPDEYESSLAQSLIAEEGIDAIREWMAHNQMDTQLEEYRHRITREERVAMAGTPLGYFGIDRAAGTAGGVDQEHAAKQHWTKGELVDIAEISDTTFDRIRDDAQMPGAKRGQRGFQFNAVQLRELIDAAQRMPNAPQCLQAASRWSKLVDKS